MQRVPNYGSFLQAYGLRSVLQKMGHEVIFLDYEEGKPAVPYSEKEYLKYKITASPVFKFINDHVKYDLLKRKEFVYEYRMKYLKELGISYRRNTGKKVDAVIIGSDEVFNCLQAGFNVGFSPMLFGQNLNADKVLSYAASFGYTDITGIRKYGLQSKLKSYFAHFDNISVRDQNSYEIIREITGKEPHVNLDPVLIADYDIPDVKIPYQNYVILYTYKTRKYSEEEKQAIKDFCERNGKTLISVGNAQSWVEHRVHASPLELLAYIKNADFIITDTFHGSVLSIKYNKAFATLIRNDNSQKLSDLLRRLHKEERIISSYMNLQEMFEKEIDYTETNETIQKEREHAYAYLKNSLK